MKKPSKRGLSGFKNVNNETYNRLVEILLRKSAEIQAEKQPAYILGNEDMLYNFKHVAARAKCSPGQVLCVYLLKHIDAITAALCQPALPQAEEMEGRFADAINYLKMGFALIKELELVAKAEQQIQKGSTPRSGGPFGELRGSDLWEALRDQAQKAGHVSRTTDAHRTTQEPAQQFEPCAYEQWDGRPGLKSPAPEELREPKAPAFLCGDYVVGRDEPQLEQPPRKTSQ